MSRLNFCIGTSKEFLVNSINCDIVHFIREEKTEEENKTHWDSWLVTFHIALFNNRCGWKFHFGWNPLREWDEKNKTKRKTGRKKIWNFKDSRLRKIMTLLADQFTQTIYVLKQIAGKWQWLLRCVIDITAQWVDEIHTGNEADFFMRTSLSEPGDWGTRLRPGYRKSLVFSSNVARISPSVSSVKRERCSSQLSQSAFLIASCWSLSSPFMHIFIIWKVWST